ncbi:hypothetical protein J1N35_022435 [Gossypium stocksii]|uniref:Uncharacterized protein n=1 Tax=Gossypium stocksii TaxID=47602 RepID=A0A9D4A3F8_9ROSI|nr:hypothetical protein J1N35_022435 [Gossypium stocksii]
MELVDDEDAETMAALCCRTESVNIELIQLFAELVNVKPVEDITLLSEQYGVQGLCMEVLRVFFDRQSSTRGFNIDFNAPPTSENLNPDGENGYDNNVRSDHEVKDYSNPNLDEVPDDINDECACNNSFSVVSEIVAS